MQPTTHHPVAVILHKRFIPSTGQVCGRCGVPIPIGKQYVQVTTGSGSQTDLCFPCDRRLCLEALDVEIAQTDYERLYAEYEELSRESLSSE